MGTGGKGCKHKAGKLAGLLLGILLFAGSVSGEASSEFPVRPVPAAAIGGTTTASEGDTALMGYTEAEIRQQLLQKYGRPLPQYRRLSGSPADTEYQPGTLDVKIPSYFFPASVPRMVGEDFLWNADGSLGLRPEVQARRRAEAAASEKRETGQMEAAAERENSSKQADAALDGPKKQPWPVSAGQGKKAEANRPAPRYKRIEVQILELGKSPFPALYAHDFLWLKNDRGGYNIPLPRLFRQDPLKGLPAEGPMLLRHGAEDEILAVTVDDPADTYYYKNAGTLPLFGKAKPVFSETRRNTGGMDVDIQYIRYYTGGHYSLVVLSAVKNGGKTYRTAVVFPESKQYEYLPRALYMIENQKVIPVTAPVSGVPAAPGAAAAKKA